MDIGVLFCCACQIPKDPGVLPPGPFSRENRDLSQIMMNSQH